MKARERDRLHGCAGYDRIWSLGPDGKRDATYRSTLTMCRRQRSGEGRNGVKGARSQGLVGERRRAYRRPRAIGWPLMVTVKDGTEGGCAAFGLESRLESGKDCRRRVEAG
jgi:hypothetical protein